MLAGCPTVAGMQRFRGSCESAHHEPPQTADSSSFCDVLFVLAPSFIANVLQINGDVNVCSTRVSLQT